MQAMERERETYSKYLEAMKKLIPEEAISEEREGKKKGEPYGLGVEKIPVTVALILLAAITAISLLQVVIGSPYWIPLLGKIPVL